MRVLVTGAAGYIGSHALKALQLGGHDVVALDDLRRGHVQALRGVELIRTAVHDRPVVERALRERRIDAVLHFAASCYVGESVERPLEYYENNVVGTLRLAEACVAAGVGTFVLSSTAATYGEPDVAPIPEETPRRPVNPYGRSKAMAEDVLTDCARASTLRPIFLRYFNAAGADPDGELGEDHDPETHLVPNALRAALGETPGMKIFGDDYDTPDGTCVRDYVHVTDLADAHVRALEFAAGGGSCRAFNLGSGSGYSVRQVVDTVREVTGRDFPVSVEPRRAGDPPTLVASSSRAREELGWRPRHERLRTIVETAWAWFRAHPNGYE